MAKKSKKTNQSISNEDADTQKSAESSSNTSSSHTSSSMVRGQYLASRLYRRFEGIILLSRINKPIGIFLLLWPTLWAIWIASKGQPGFIIPAVFIAGVILMRSAGCAINDFADRKIDGRVKRTRERPLVTGKAKPITAVLLFIVCSLIAFSLVLLYLNTEAMVVSFVAVIIVFIYPFAKRYTHLPQIILGAGFAMAVPMAFAAYTKEIPNEAWTLFTATVLWATAYDTMYALVDKSDDVKIGVKSTAILFGDSFIKILALLYIIVMFALLLVAELVGLFSPPFLISLGIASILSGYQLFLVSDANPKKCFRAFLNNNWYGAVIFLGILYHYYLEDGQSLDWAAWLLSVYIVSIIVIYNLSMLKKANNAFWVSVACVLGPIAIPMVLFASRKR